MTYDGTADLEAAVGDLAGLLPAQLSPFAALAYNYRWSWTGGDALFAALDPERWEICRHNPVLLLRSLSREAGRRALRNVDLLDRARRHLDELSADLARPSAPSVLSGERPAAFICAEFGIHASLPIYAGGLGGLAGDILKEASDRAHPMVGVGLLYRQGYFHQRLDLSGWQHEYWAAIDQATLPAALVHRGDGAPLRVEVEMRGGRVATHVWRVQVGRTPLFLLDAQVPGNPLVHRWITARLYVSDRRTRLDQYALLGLGAVRALRALGIDPAVVHINEGHAALASLELAREGVAAGLSFDDACAAARARTVFTTHTPVPAGNENFPDDEMVALLPELPHELGIEPDGLLALGRDGANHGRFGLSPLGIRMSRSANGVSRVHGKVARAMWQPLFPDLADDDVPVGHVSNGVHVPSWMAPAMGRLLDRHLPHGWHGRAADPAVWEFVSAISDGELWEVRRSLRARLVDAMRERSTADRLGRGEERDYVESAAGALHPEALTIGFARRIATYKRLDLLLADADRALAILHGVHPVQVVLAGKAHPSDDEAKELLQRLFVTRRRPELADRVIFIEDYDLDIAAALVSGCDLWVNLPRPPMEASGTSGMKAALNGGLNLSVLDGWWAEAYDGENGWAIRGNPTADPASQDSADGSELYRLLEEEVLPCFADRDADGVPLGWVRRIKASLRSIGPRFCATRMVDEYVGRIYAG